MITHSQLLELVTYDPETGAFTDRRTGRRRGRITSAYGRALPVRRITFLGHDKSAAQWAHFYMTQEWATHLIDHKNTDGLDDRWENLRPATVGQNNANKKCYGNNKLGLKGVHFFRETGRYRAQAMKDGKRISLGLFDTAEEAHAAYVTKSQELHGEFARAA